MKKLSIPIYKIDFNLDDEINLLNKFSFLEENVLNFQQHKNNIIKIIQKQNENKLAQIQPLLANIEQIKKDNEILSTKLSVIEKVHAHISSEHKKINEKKFTHHSDIIRVRRENTKEFDSRLSKLSSIYGEDVEREIKHLKKELNLTINLTKLRVVNLDMIDEEKLIKGYLVDVDRNMVKYIELDTGEEALVNCRIYWNTMHDLLTAKSLVSVKSKKTVENKENVNTINIK